MEQLRQWWQRPAVGPSLWTGADLLANQAWIRELTTTELDQLHDATLDAWGRGRRPEQITRDEFFLPSLRSTITRVDSELNDGRGLFLLRGLNVEDYEFDKLAILYVGLASHLGNLLPQNLEGDLIRCVTDLSAQTMDEHQARGHRGRAEMLPHSDSADVVGLLCVRPAKRGGGTSVCSSATIFNEMMARHSEYLELLRQGFYFDLTGKAESGVSQRRLPVFTYERERLACQFNKTRIEEGTRRVGIHLNHAEATALDCVNELALHPNLALRFELRSGDILFLNNNYVLHARDAYEDWPESHRKRLLLRLWLKG